jgi:hypothetical protein
MGRPPVAPREERLLALAAQPLANPLCSRSCFDATLMAGLSPSFPLESRRYPRDGANYTPCYHLRHIVALLYPSPLVLASCNPVPRNSLTCQWHLAGLHKHNSSQPRRVDLLEFLEELPDLDRHFFGSPPGTSKSRGINREQALWWRINRWPNRSALRPIQQPNVDERKP